MGLFDFFFNRSKQEQDKPIRDKLKTRKDFEKILEEDLDIMKKTIAKIDTAQDINLYMYRSISYSYILIFQSKYSMDAKIGELRHIYMKSMGYFLQAFNKRNPIYADILNYVSLGLLLNIPDENFKQLIDYVKQMDKQAKPPVWTPDLLLWFMLNSRLKEDEKQTHADKLAFPKLYKGLFKLTQISDVQEAKKALKDYIEKWYNLNKDAPWYNNHLKKNCYRGYWAWEVAAVAKIINIDDSDLKDNPYYPYDMVHWEDTGTIDEDQQERS